jgi:prepilin-type N-terminal cleavage/methylation domain-containing protein/prepilin-type processing-associated H-X9-DG protein
MKRSRRAFTLVELLVVIAVIGILVALLLPAVQAARESGRRSQCVNNMKQIGLAVHQFENSHKFLPDSWYVPGDLYGSTSYGGALTKMLPPVEQAPLGGQYNWSLNWWDPRNQPWVNVRLSIYECPSAPGDHKMPGLQGLGTPVTTTVTAASGDYNILRGYNENRVPRVDGRVPGMLMGLTDNGATAAETAIKPTMSMVKDGVSNSLMFGEKGGQPGFWVKGKEIGEGVSASGYDAWNGLWASYSSAWVRTFSDDGLVFSWTGGPCVINCQNGYGAIYGFHETGANFLFGDGSVRLLRESMSVDVMFALLSRSGGEVVSPNDF